MNNCYTVPFATDPGGGSLAGDLNATYSRLFYRVYAKYELFVVGEYPQARYMSFVPYDDHLAVVSWLYDAQIVPAQANYVNPFIPGNLFLQSQLYVIALQFGGKQPTKTIPGCGFGPTNMYANVFDATLRHPGLSWNGMPNLPLDFPVHDDTGPSHAGELLVRAYLEQPDAGSVQLQSPVVIARDLKTGCAAPAAKVWAMDANSETLDTILATDTTIGSKWQQSAQIQAHGWIEADKRNICYPYDPHNQAVWFAEDQYSPAGNPDAGYMDWTVSPSQLSWLLNNKGFMRFRTRLPQMANIPCAGCTLTGLEQLRYWSVSFNGTSGSTMATISDPAVTRDANGYATVVVGFGSQPPSWVTAANGYTYMDLSTNPAVSTLQTVNIRTILPTAPFNCSAANVPFYSMEYNPQGGYMGEYVPTVDFLLGFELPQTATPYPRSDTCALVPKPGTVCGPPPVPWP